MSISKRNLMKMKNEFIHMQEVSPGIKPNFSYLARQYGLSRQTISKYWKDPMAKPKPRKKRTSKFDPYSEQIREKFQYGDVSIQSVFKYFQMKYPDVFTQYNSFKSYVRTHQLNVPGPATYPRIRYETAPGDELQVDWKESLTMTLKSGEVIEYNLFSAVFGYSRYTMFIYTRTKTTEDFMRCLMETLQQAGGVPKMVKTDNMSAVVTFHNRKRRIKSEIIQFAKDLGTHITLCKAHSPESKGKVESANRFAKWLEPYQNELNSEEELIETINRINQQINAEPSRTTGETRSARMKTEKEYLQPLPNQAILDSYLKDVDTQKVSNTLLINWKGHGYSVPKDYQNKRVKMLESNGNLNIYYNANLIASHPLTTQAFVYDKTHYKEGMKDRIPRRPDESEEDYESKIERKAAETLDLLKNLKGTVK